MKRITLTAGEHLDDAIEHHEGINNIAAYYSFDTRYNRYSFVQLESGVFYATIANQVIEAKLLHEVVDFFEKQDASIIQPEF